MFLIALTNVLVTLFFIIPGFALGKSKIAKTEHLPTISAILLYIGSPFLEISAYLSLDDVTLSDVGDMGLFFLLSMASMILFVLLLYFIFHKKYQKDATYRVATAASVMGNLGFFGLPIIRAIFPDNPEVAAYSQIYMLGMNIIVFSLGVYCLTGDKKYMSLKKALVNPTTIGFVFAFICYAFKLKYVFPSALIKAIDSIGAMTTPLCMMILGIRLSYIPFKKLALNYKAYIIVALKLIAYPLFVYLLVFFIPLETVLKSSLIILSAVPCAAVVLSLAEIHHSETEISANVILLSTILCFITIPLFTLLVEMTI